MFSKSAAPHILNTYVDDFVNPGARPRDDDITEPFGGVTYVYNDADVIVSAPVASNSVYHPGNVIYTGRCHRLPTYLT